ncbi:MAG: hypothetical protein ABR551_01755 [Gemmatimonadales bacterium]
MTQGYRSEAPGVTVAAVVPAAERTRLDVAGSGCFQVVHRESVGDAVRVVRERPVDAVLVSVHECADAHIEAVGRLVRSFPPFRRWR